MNTVSYLWSKEENQCSGIRINLPFTRLVLVDDQQTRIYLMSDHQMVIRLKFHACDVPANILFLYHNIR